MPISDFLFPFGYRFTTSLYESSCTSYSVVFFPHHTSHILHQRLLLQFLIFGFRIWCFRSGTSLQLYFRNVREHGAIVRIVIPTTEEFPAKPGLEKHLVKSNRLVRRPPRPLRAAPLRPLRLRLTAQKGGLVQVVQPKSMLLLALTLCC